MSSIQTDLSLSPHFDDFDDSKKYYKVLFQPGVSVQVRELNQLQTILQDQISKFGNNILKRGTVVEGCNVNFWPKLPYVKIKDLTTEGVPVNVNEIQDLHVRNGTNLTAKVSIVEDGLESASPNLKTLFVNYTNSGDSGTETQFQADQVLTVFDPNNKIFSINVNNGSSGFSNSDLVVVTSSVAVQNSSGGKAITINGRPIQQNDILLTDTLSRAKVVSVDNSVEDRLILTLKPLAEDLRAGDSDKWNIQLNSVFEASAPGTTNKSTGNRIIDVYGQGATAGIVTDRLGKVVNVYMVNAGSGYVVPPEVTVSSSTASINETNQFEAQAQTFLTNITIASPVSSPVGFGYGLSVDSGVIYQKGYFLRVDEQFVVVEKYNNTGFNKSVGFFTEESIIDSNVDTSLLDNAIGQPNYTAPGAKRLKLVPVLRVVNEFETEVDTDFYPIVQFSDGQPFRKNTQTQYNVIGDMIAERTFEESGNYVLDKFNVVSRDTSNVALSSTSFNLFIDPGTAYIRGYRVSTDSNFTTRVDKGIDTESRNNVSMILGYGDYFRVNQLAGNFRFDIGDYVEFYDAPASYLSTSTFGVTNIAPVGNKIGSARVRCIVLESGYAGTPSAVYRFYTFNRVFESGRNASQIRSIYHPGSMLGICDIVQENNQTILYDKDFSSMVFRSGTAVKAVSNTTYYTKESNQFNLGTDGKITISVSDPLTESMDDFAENTFAENEIVVTPLVNFQASTNLTGTISVSSGSNVVTGSGTSFLTQLAVGDVIRINNNPSLTYQISGIANDTSLTVTANVTSHLNNTSARRYFAKDVPISLSTPNSLRTAEVVSNQLQIDLGLPVGVTLVDDSLTAISPSVVVSYNIKKRFTASVTKNPVRNAYVRLNIANNASGTEGPWPLGVSDVFRLRNVWKANGEVQAVYFSTNANSINATSNFISTVNNPFSNGDVVVYSTSTGTSALPGLTNAASYVVLNSNSSTFQLGNVTNQAVIDINTDFQNAIHGISGRTLFFTPTTHGVQDVTNQFVVDNNQTVEYLDTSYLVKKVGTSVSNTDILLVSFDAYEQTNVDGPKTVSSYTINDSTSLDSIAAGSVSIHEIPEFYENRSGTHFDLRDCIDIRPSSASTVALVSNSGAFTRTDLINPIEPFDYSNITVQFAAASANASGDTVVIASNPFSVGEVLTYSTTTGSTSVMNGITNNSLVVVKTSVGNTVSFASYTDGVSGSTIDIVSGSGTHNLQRALTRFNQTKKYFPVPGSVCTFNVESYIGRTDRVVIGTDSNFRVMRGSPGNIDAVPNEPSDAMTIDLLRIPPYPSLPQVLSPEVAKLVDTKVVNQRNLRRKEDYKVSTVLDETTKSRIQTKPYRMQDIASIERRVDNLEYYVSVTLAESLAKSRFIPSRINNNLDRFKFGIFVDSFADYSLADSTHPEYNATIFDDTLNSKGNEVNVRFDFDLDSESLVGESTSSYPYEEYPIVSQLDSTVDVVLETSIPLPDTVTGPVANPNVPTVFEEDVTEVSVTQIIESAYGQYRSSATGGFTKDVYEDWTFTFSSLPGLARFYINARDQRVQIEVYQGTTPDVEAVNPVTTSLNWQQWALTDSAPGGPASGLDTIAALRGANFQSFPWVEDCFKLYWNHNPANGQYYKIRIFKGKHIKSGIFKTKRKSPVGFYAFRLWYPSDQIVSTTRRVVSNQRFAYTGRIHTISPDSFTFTKTTVFNDLSFILGNTNAFYISDSQRFDISVVGLRPSTAHSFFFENEDRTDKCVQIRNSASSGTVTLMSDANGVLNFSFFYDAGITESTSDFEELNRLAASLSGRKKFSISNSDNTSNASGTIDLKYYAIENNVEVLPEKTTSRVTISRGPNLIVGDAYLL